MEKVEVVLGNVVDTPGSEDYIAKQQRWLLFLRHCAKCTAQPGECQYGQPCTVAKALWRHILECANPQCPYPRSKSLSIALLSMPAQVAWQSQNLENLVETTVTWSGVAFQRPICC